MLTIVVSDTTKNYVDDSSLGLRCWSLSYWLNWLALSCLWVLAQGHYSITGEKYNKLKYMGLIYRVYIPMDTSRYESI